MGKKILLIAITSLLCSIGVLAQTDSGSIMILPSDNWCTMRHFTKTSNSQGVTNKLPDYRRAFQEDSELNNVLSKVGELLIDKGYSIKDANQAIKSVDHRLAEDEATYSTTSGAEITLSPIDILKMRIKSDIVIQLNWTVQKDVLSYTIEAFDSYTNKRIATSTETKKRNSKPIALQIQDMVKKNIKPFHEDMQRHLSDMNSNGREITINIRTWSNSPFNLESEIEGDELLLHIQHWLRDNALKHQFIISDATENMALIEQVRIPKEKDGMILDARTFLVGLQKHLNKLPFKITSKVISNGLGCATLIIGEK